MTIRLAVPGDGAGVAEIYRPVVEESAVSFEWHPPDAAEMHRRIEETLPLHPWLVSEAGGALLGYAYAAPHRPRPAYQWTVEVSVYVRPEAQRRGVASGLYRALFAVLRVQGFRTACAVIALPNPGSVALHERLGFQRIGVLPAAGYKHGRWHDVGWWRLVLREADDAPEPPRPLHALRDTPALAQCLGGSP